MVILARYLSRRTKRRSGRDAECLASQHTTDTFKVPSQPFLSLRSSSTIQSKNGLGQFTQTLAGSISTISSITRYVIDINHTSLFKELLYCNCLIGLAHQFKRGPKWELFPSNPPIDSTNNLSQELNLPGNSTSRNPIGPLEP